MKPLLAVMICVLLTLGACGPLPRPFGREFGEAPNPLADGIFREGVEVPPLTGTTRPMGKLLAKSIASRLEADYEIPAAIEGLNRSQFLLTGIVRSNENVPDARTLVSIDWHLSERDGTAEGKTVAAFTEDVPASRVEWDYGSPQVLDRIGITISTRVAQLVLGDRFGGSGKDRYLGRRGVFVDSITGAPGDGNAALRRSMAIALGGGGVQLAPSAEQAAFTVDATVELAAPDSGTQAIRIVWLIKDVAGEIVGRAEQANAVPTGSLDGRWGQTAAFIAAAAMDGIADVIGRKDSSKFTVPDLGSGPYKPSTPPPHPALPRIPGRAPPPPS